MGDDEQIEFFESCCAQSAGTMIGEGAFAPGPALWVGRREIAHFDDDRTIDVRLTKQVTRSRRSELRDDGRVSLRPGGSDWLEVTIGSPDDTDWARSIVLDAIEANRGTAPEGTPPTSPELDRRRRFH